MNIFITKFEAYLCHDDIYLYLYLSASHTMFVVRVGFKCLLNFLFNLPSMLRPPVDETDLCRTVTELLVPFITTARVVLEYFV